MSEEEMLHLLGLSEEEIVIEPVEMLTEDWVRCLSTAEEEVAQPL